MKTVAYLLISLTIFGIAQANACEVSVKIGPNQPRFNFEKVCLEQGTQKEFSFSRYPIAESISVAQESTLDGQCTKAPFILDTWSLKLTLGPDLQTGCYVISYQFAR